jgi:hypothetical protein
MTAEELEQIARIMGNTTKAAEERLNAKIEHAEERLNARIEHAETTLLTEFHKWASPLEARVRTHAAAIRAIDVEQEYQADRLSRLDGKKPEARNRGKWRLSEESAPAFNTLPSRHAN